MPSNPLRVSAGMNPYEEEGDFFLNRNILGNHEYVSCFNSSIEMMEGKSHVQEKEDLKGKKVFNEPKKTTVPKSFKEALAGSSSNNVSGISVSTSLVNGIPAILVSDEDLKILAEPYKLALVGKFSSRRPNMDEIRNFFHGLKLLGSFSVSLLDARHIFINLSNELDYNRIFLKRSYYVRNFVMRILKWSTDFDIHAESPICPVWLSLPNLRMHFFDIKMLQAIGSLFGRPLQVDQPTANKTRPSVARILIEIDITKEYPEEIWLGSESNGYSQKVIFDQFPVFCSHCKMHGHVVDNCFILKPWLKKKEVQSNQINPTNSPSKEEVHENSLNEYLEKMEKDLENLQDPKHNTELNVVSDVLSTSIMEKHLDLVVYDENIALQNSFGALNAIPAVIEQPVSNKTLPIRLESEIHVQEHVEVPISDVIPIENCAFNKNSESFKEGFSLEKTVGKAIVNNDLEEGEWESGFCSETELVVGVLLLWFGGCVVVGGGLVLLVLEFGGWFFRIAWFLEVLLCLVEFCCGVLLLWFGGCVVVGGGLVMLVLVGYDDVSLKSLYGRLFCHLTSMAAWLDVAASFWVVVYFAVDGFVAVFFCAVLCCWLVVVLAGCFKKKVAVDWLQIGDCCWWC
ncbi:hypothetical protein M5K25_002374 [Dendrobium thyrsiflorum]|uniref:DUF4283 domain-containing protein n=1 Tax=Dendrobium thyrsiflorum TaxID=117978 RepID=A0ABD0VM52_DENTH